MIARIAYFDAFDLAGRDWVLDALEGADGFHGAYHLRDEATGGSISISFWNDEASAASGNGRVAAASQAGGHTGPGPDRVAFLQVLRHVRG
jgi:heme-degrading monooxygenase HmoA